MHIIMFMYPVNPHLNQTGASNAHHHHKQSIFSSKAREGVQASEFSESSSSLNMAQAGIPCTPAETHGTHNNQHNTEIPAKIRNSDIGQEEKGEKKHCFRGVWLQKLQTETQ